MTSSKIIFSNHVFSSLENALQNDDDEFKQAIFEDCFFRDLEKGFTADIACCDNCQDRFLHNWPLANVYNNYEFQTSATDLELFYSNGSLRDSFSLEEFRIRIKKIFCPNCGEPLSANIWPYNLPIEVSETVRQNIDEVAQLSRGTPSLVLTHPYAKAIFDEIQHLGTTNDFWETDVVCHRARAAVPGKIWTADDFKWPPNAVTSEGRYNHAGLPVLYVGSTVNTCFHEMRRPATGIAVADLQIRGRLKILDLVRKLALDGNVLQSLVWSALVSSPEEGEGWHKPQYAFTRFLADCAQFAGFHGIRYVSVRVSQGNNLAIFNSQGLNERITISNIREHRA